MASDSLGRFRFLSGVVEGFDEEELLWAKGFEVDDEPGTMGVPGVNEDEKRAMVRDVLKRVICCSYCVVCR